MKGSRLLIRFDGGTTMMEYARGPNHPLPDWLADPPPPPAAEPLPRPLSPPRSPRLQPTRHSRHGGAHQFLGRETYPQSIRLQHNGHHTLGGATCGDCNHTGGHDPEQEA
ncbi:hypothetical protein BDZ91DRAFT_51861 [Kalaharituber pfeilii]|nr:hypothetical protein BDZ91DRAFT_51861 [Kalaharituber pfeilii]